ncbi:MAG TPA: ComEC/Rec2 family competence protein [Candidatus Binataceae bacterium]|nr:ComEC/Rec2 family competence protein [Candidatus Binataceae bacterium]
MTSFLSAALLEIAPIYLVAGAIVAGDALGLCTFAPPPWAAAVAAFGALLLYIRRTAAVAMALALIAIAAAAASTARKTIAPPRSRSSLASFADGATVTVEGWIDRAPERFADREYVYVDVERAGLDAATMRRVRGTIRVTVIGGSADVRVGDEVELRGALRFARAFGDPGEFDYAAYLARNAIAARLVLNPRSDTALAVIGHRSRFPQAQIAAVRTRIGALIDAGLVGDERAELRALVIGDRGGITRGLRERFARTGLAHMLVISGLHFGCVAAAAFATVRLVMSLVSSLCALGYANKLAAACAALAVMAYAAIAGHHVSTTRALVMVLAYTLAVVTDRAREVMASLALAAIVICLAMPGSSGDIGFQLSFVSVIAIVLGMRRFTAWWRLRLERRDVIAGPPSRAMRMAAVVGGYVAVSFWALLGVAPLTAYHFNQFSAVGVVANAVVVPVMALGGVVCGLAGCLVGLVAPTLGVPVLRMAGWALWLGTALAGWFVEWPAAYFRTFTPTLLEIAIAYGWLLLWLSRPFVWPEGAAAPAGQPRPAAVGSAVRLCPPARWRIAALALLAVATAADAGWWSGARWFDQGLRVTFLSVGEGDAAVVRFGGGRVMLIDAGGAWPDGFDFGERVVARYLWTKKIMHVDYLVVSHPDLDHFGGMAFVARNFSPAEFWTSGAISTDAAYRALMAQIAAEDIPVRIVNSAMPPVRIAGATVRCLNPQPGEVASSNNLSMVLRIAQRGRSVMFTGDLEAEGERTLLAHVPESELASTVLKAPHHGSRTSSSAPFVEAVHPRVTVVSLGYRNRFHFPAPEVVERYRESGALVLRTDMDGAVSIEFAPDSIGVRTYNGGAINLPPAPPAVIARGE